MIRPPTNCPSCESLLERSNDQLYCRNPNCSALTQKSVEHFAKTLKIKGLGPSTIDKLNLSRISEIYELEEEYVSSALGSERLAEKLMIEIEESKKRSLNEVLPALGIPLIGKSATDKLSAVVTSIFDITEETCKEAGLGDKATSNLVNWLASNDEYLDLPFSLEFDTPRVTSKGNAGIVCISGKLNSYSTKQQAKQDLELLGFTVKDSLTKDVTVLVNESGKETAKTTKARASGVTIVTDLKKFIGDFNK